jgi:glycosyltransferase involved in cell wall biosynthesis
MVAGANFALNVVLARWLSPDEYGGFAVMFSLFLFIAGFHNAMILEPMNVLGASRSSDSLPRYLGALLWVQIATLAGLSGVLSITAVVADSLYQSLAKPLLGLGLALPWLLFFWFFRQVCYLKMKPSLAFCGGLAYLIFVTVGLALLRMAHGVSTFNAFIILGLSSVAATLILWRLLISVSSGPSLRTPDPIDAVLKEHWNYGRWVLGSAFVYCLSNFFYLPLVSAFAGLSQAGALRAMQNLVAPAHQLLTACNLLWLPWTARQTQGTDKSKLRRTFLAILGSMSLAVIGYALLLVMFAAPLTALLYGQGTYSQYLWIIPYLAVALVIGGINNGLMLVLKALRRPDQVLFSQSGSALVTLTVGVYLVWQFGILGVAIGSILSVTTVCLILARHLGKSTMFAKGSSVGIGQRRDRIAWLLPSLNRGSYWHPVFQEFARLFPETIIFTGNWQGFAVGSENAFKVHVIGKTRYVNFHSLVSGKVKTFILAPLGIVPSVLGFCPQVIFTSAFSLWTMLVVLLKPWKRWRIIVLYDGSAPSVDSKDSRLKLLLRRLITKNVDALITNSHAGKEYLAGVLHADHKKVFRHPYQVPSAAALLADPDKHAAEPALMNLKHPVFMFVGQLIARKGIEFLLDACFLLNQDRRTCYTLLIAGDGPKRTEIEEKISSRELTNEVHLLGWVNYAQIGSYLKLSDVFVFPTLEDIWGMVILEAMVCGKPILCSKWAGTSEMVIDGENGYVFDPYQPAQLAALMRRFIDDPSLIASMGKHSTRIIEPHSPRAAAEGLAHLAAVVLKNQRILPPLST